MDNLYDIYKTFYELKKVICVQKDKNGCIIYPDDKETLNLYKEILQTDIKTNNEFYHRKSKTWYGLIKKEITVDNEIQYLEFLEDITKTKEIMHNLKIDKLTKLLKDRAEVNELINDYIDHAIEKNEEFSLIMADVDEFKRINDTYGHKCGDIVLQNVGILLLESTRQSNDKFDYRPSDIVVRIGGDEFLILLKNINLYDTKKRIKNIKKKIKDLNIIYLNEEVNVNMSFGYCHIKETKNLKETNIQDLRENISEIADEFLYTEKREKKTKVSKLVKKENKKM